jgi:signal transduction histidine kinase
MLRRLPYRIQVPFGLSVAVLVTALLVTGVSARISTTNARALTLATLERAVVLLVAQAKPLLAGEDTWRMFAFLRDTAALVPGTLAGHARLAVLDTRGDVFAASDPTRLATGQALLGQPWHGHPLPPAAQSTRPLRLNLGDGAFLLLEPILSEDGQIVGHVFIEVDASVFEPDWHALFTTALVGVALAALFLVPLGWLVGKRMTRPVAQLISFIERIGHEPAQTLRGAVPRVADPELGRITQAVSALVEALEQRAKAEARALSAERLAAVGRMTAAVAHEINNPLMGLLTATQTVRLHGDNASIRERTVEVLDRGLQQIRTTLAALLPQARIEDRPLEPGDLDDVMALVRASAQSQSTALTQSMEIDSALRVPSAPLRQVMLNLLLNAIKAAGPDGEVLAILKSDAQRVQFSVLNSGKRLLADRFEAALESESGMNPHGFGLWVCRELANHYRGGFELDTSNSEGTRLVFWLPNHELPDNPYEPSAPD